MSDKRKDSAGCNIQFGGGFFLLTILFVILKITDEIDWSWWWVFAPLWLPWAIVLGICAAGLLIACIVAGVVMLFDRRW